MGIKERLLVAFNDEGGYTTTMEYHGHQLVADEPEELNGDNKGPDPFGFILAGLTSCVAITLRMYIQRKEMKVRRIAIEASMNEDKEIKLLLEVDADITEQEHKRLGQIAEMCPVHKFLKKEAVITKEMV